MDRQAIFAWAKAQYGTEPDYPWKDRNAVLRHGENNKWYGVILAVGREKLGMAGEEKIDILNVKCDPALGGLLRMEPGFKPAYHMNKEKWITILLDGSVPEKTIKELIGFSYAMTAPGGKNSRKIKGDVL